MGAETTAAGCEQGPEVGAPLFARALPTPADLAMLSRADARKLCEHPRNNRHGQPTKKAQVIFDKTGEVVAEPRD